MISAGSLRNVNNRHLVRIEIDSQMSFEIKIDINFYSDWYFITLFFLTLNRKGLSTFELQVRSVISDLWILVGVLADKSPCTGAIPAGGDPLPEGAGDQPALPHPDVPRGRRPARAPDVRQGLGHAPGRHRKAAPPVISSFFLSAFNN
jgi:hypothetical protein